MPIALDGKRVHMPASSAKPLRALPTEGLSGTLTVPGDKSISHRAVMLCALAVGESRIHGLLEGEDVLRSAAAMGAMGAHITPRPDNEEDGVWRIAGCGLGGLVEPEDVLDMGNAGTGARLLMGVLTGHPVTAVLTGDASLRRRPMERVATPLQAIGASIMARAGCRLPLAITGSAEPMPLRYRLPVASAQVKSAILLAGLNTPGRTTVIEPEPTRDHTELMLRHFGVEVSLEDSEEGPAISVEGEYELAGRDIHVPGDPSSAAFPAVAAAILPGAEVTLPAVGMNPRRAGLFDTLLEMGADITLSKRRTEAGEPVADLLIKGARLSGVEVPPERAPSMIDEYPILCVAAALAEGRTVMRGIGELRFKESDRLSAMARGLQACGVKVEAGEDYLIVEGTGARPRGGATIATELDHRIAMSFLVLGLASEKPVAVDDVRPVDTSFPGFERRMRALGARLEPDVEPDVEPGLEPEA